MKTAIKIIRRILVSMLLGILALVIWFWVPACVQYHITERYAFSAKQKGAQVRLALLLPKSGPYQTVEHVVVAWDGRQAREPHEAVEGIKLEGHVQKGETKQAVVTYDVALWQGRARWDGPVEAFQLQPQREIESDQAVLLTKASQITTGQSRGDGYRVYKFTSSHLLWPLPGIVRTNQSQSALKAYQTRVGVCGDFAHLMVALCRAAKIPAQSISGLAMPAYPPLWSATQTWGHPGVAHAWVEFHTAAGWEMADPSAACLMPFKRVWFGRTDGYHLSYGEEGSENRIYHELMDWANQPGKGLGSISTPIKFAAAADVGGVSITPQVTVKVGWNTKWLGLFLVLVVAVVRRIYWLTRRLKQPAVVVKPAAAAKLIQPSNSKS